jgi:DNA repair protein REV1
MSYQNYYQNKQIKLAVQFKDSARSSIFKGHVIYLNGYTGETSMRDMKILIFQNGGLVQEFLSSAVTLIIATQMTSSKIQDIKQPIIKPEWLHECIKFNRLLDYRPFLLKIEFNPFVAENIDTDTEPEIKITTKCTDADFVPNFFASSRLHHLSTWKSELSELMVKHGHRINSVNQTSLIMHIDMDCYFASVATRNRPDLKDMPVVVAHCQNATTDSTSEVACANYAARRLGVNNGSYLGDAKKLIPDLIVMPYNFQEYSECSRLLYDVLIENCDFVQAVSCDEAYVDVTKIYASQNEAIEVFAKQFASKLTQLIFDRTSCPASVGIGSNLLLARLATKKAKPNNVFYIHETSVSQFMQSIRVSDLPGVGYKISRKLESLNIHTCADALTVKKESLQASLGVKTGQMIYNYCRGVDDRILENKKRQSIGAEINWGLRFEKRNDVDSFIERLCSNVYERFINTGRTCLEISVNAKKRNYAGEPSKYLGHGRCINFTKSAKMACNSHSQLVCQVKKMYYGLGIPDIDMRGFGVHLKISDHAPLSFGTPKKDSFEKKFGFKLSEIDPQTLPYLPSDILSEINKYIQNSSIEFRNTLPPVILNHFNAHCSDDTINTRKRKLSFENLEKSQREIPKMDERENITMSQVDPEVFESLPDSIQEEFKSKWKTAHMVQKKRTPTLLGEHNKEIVISWIWEWIGVRACPDDNDTKILTEYLVSCVHANDLETVAVVLRILKSCIDNRKQKFHPKWEAVVAQIEQNVSQTVLQVYGSHFVVS